LSWMPAACVLVSLAAAALILLSRRSPRLRETWTLLAAFVKFGLVASLAHNVIQGKVVECRILSIASGLDLKLRADGLGIVFALVASSLWILTSFYSIGYIRGAGEKRATRYFASFAVCLSATMGIAFSANVLTFVLFYEMLTLATYPLVVHKQTPEAISAGRKYLVYTLSAGLCLFAATGWTYLSAGTLEFTAGGFLHEAFRNGAFGRGGILVLFALFMAGAGVKAGLMPLHSWLPSAMVAPTPVSALLHAVAVVKAGVFAAARFVGFVFGPDLLREIGAWQILAWVSVVTIVVASLIAMAQDNLKRRLAYSTIGHLAYIVLGAALLTPSSWTGSVLHLVNHATMKITLFFCAGAVYVTAHKEKISELNGIGRRMPVTMVAFAAASVGLAGIPPVNGFASKWYLAAGTLEAHRGFFLAMLLLSGLLNAAYLFPIVHAAFFKRSDEHTRVEEASLLMLIPLCLTALVSVALGIWPNLAFGFLGLAKGIAASVVGGGP